MAHVQRAIRLIFFTVWAVFMTSLTYFLGAPSLKVLRRRLGRTKYWAFNALISVGLFLTPQGKMWGVTYFSLVVLMGVLEEFEEMEFSLIVGGFFTLVINSLISAGMFALWISATGPSWKSALLSWLEPLRPLTEMISIFGVHVTVNDLMLALPGLTVYVWVIAIYVAILLENRLATGEMTVKGGATLPGYRPQLGMLRLPDAVIWVFIASLLAAVGGFVPFVAAVVGVNVIIVCQLLFFFQGIAVVVKTCEAMRVGKIWLTIAMVLAVLQFGWLVSLLGLLDYWLDFRTRLSKRAESFNREA